MNAQQIIDIITRNRKGPTVDPYPPNSGAGLGQRPGSCLYVLLKYTFPIGLVSHTQRPLGLAPFLPADVA